MKRYVMLMMVVLVAAFAWGCQPGQDKASEPRGAAGDVNFAGNSGFNSICRATFSSPDTDPIGFAKHLHHFFANEGPITNTTTAADLAKNPDQCSREGQKSSGWVPNITYGGKPATLVSTGWYYISGDNRGVDIDPSKTIPNGIPFGMQTLARENVEENSGTYGNITWYCGAKNFLNATESMPQRCGEDSLGVDVTFSPCWDGKKPASGPWSVVPAVNLPNDGKNYNVCPTSHPKQTLVLQQHLNYRITPGTAGAISVTTDAGPSPEETFHADYFNSENLRALTDRCIKAGTDRDKEFCNS